MSDKTSEDEDFRRLLSSNCCSCNNKDCKKLLEQYYYNESSIYPNGKAQLLFKINNPSMSTGKISKKTQRQQQLYDRAAILLKVENYQDKNFIRIGIIHYSPIVIKHFNNTQTIHKGKVFTDYLLQSDLVSSSKLGVKFTNVDKFNCIGTAKEARECKNNHKCVCNRFLNVPFVTVASNEIVNTGSERSKRRKAFSDSREVTMSLTEAEVQKIRASRIEAKGKKKEESLMQKNSRLNSRLEGVRKILTYAQEKITALSPLKRKVASLEKDKASLEKDKAQMSNECSTLKEKEERTAKRAKKYYDMSQRSDSPFGIPTDELKKLGLCRQSLLDTAWHALNPEASRSLLNFDTFDECMGYIGVLFPQLREEIAKLKESGAKQYVNRKYLSPLEQCMLCRLSPKVGIHDLQIGFIYGIKQPAVSKIKRKWMPLWAGHIKEWAACRRQTIHSRLIVFRLCTRGKVLIDSNTVSVPLDEILARCDRGSVPNYSSKDDPLLVCSCFSSVEGRTLSKA